MISNVLPFVIIGSLTFSLVHAEETQGTPGVDYPIFATAPNSSFKCSDQQFIPGFYADVETQCQVYHYCSEEGQETFLCPVGSIFNQAKLVCDEWYNFNCSLASQSYSSNSGLLLESAIKNVPLLIKLRNRAQNRHTFTVPATNFHEKISLYDDAELNQSSTEGSSVSNDVHEQDQDTSDELPEENLNEDESLDDILNKLEAKIENDETIDKMYEESVDENEEASENVQTNLFFDPVTERYYVDSESSQNEWSQNIDNDQFDFYDRDSFANKYDLAMKDAEESSDFVASKIEPTDLYGLDGMNNEEAEYDQFFERQMDLEQPFRRLRRKPIYSVVKEDYGEDEIPIGITDDMDSVMDSEAFSTESVLVTDVDSQPSVEITTENVGVPSTMAPFEMVEDLSRMHMTPLNITDVPMTSEEFEDAIISELIVPKLEEHDLKVLASSSEQDQPTDGYADDTSSDIRNDDYGYVENESPEQFVYDAENDAENVETESETSDEIGDTAEYYRNDETADGDSGKTDETFVVIPDESEITEFSEAFDSSESSAESGFQDLRDQSIKVNDATRDSRGLNIPMSYESESGYSAADPSQYHTSQYSPSDEYAPEQYFQNTYFNPENRDSSSPYGYENEAQPMGSKFHQYGLEANNPANRFMYASPASYPCQQQFGYSNCMYGPQTAYPYAGYYDNPYVNFHHGASNVGQSSEYPVSDVDGSYSSESPVSYMIPSDSNVNNEQFEINPDIEHPNLYKDRSLDGSEYEALPPYSPGAVLKDENVSQEETFYVLEDDDETTSEVYPETASETPIDDVVLSDASGNKDETYYVLEDDDDETTSEVDPETASETPIVNVVSDATGNKDETYYILDDEDEEKMMQDDPGFETFSDDSESEEIQKQLTSSQEKHNLEEPSSNDSVDVMPPQKPDSKDVSQSIENTVPDGDNAESLFESKIDSGFTHSSTSASFSSESDHGNVLLDSSERLGQKDEKSKVLLSSHENLPNTFLNNMAYSDPINFGPHGFGSSLGQKHMGSPTSFSFANGQKPSGDSPNASKLSALQERIRSLKQGKFGAFKKKYRSSSGNKH